MMRFAHPWWLVLAPVAIALLFLRTRARHRPTVTFSSLAALEGLPVTFAQRIRKFLPFAEGAGLLSLIMALALPQAGREEVNHSTLGVAIEMVIDRSGSMRQADLDDDPFDRKEIRRIDVVKDVVRDFVDEGGSLPGRPDDLVGLITFCGYVQSHCPLTLDHAAFLKVVATIELPEIRTDARGNPDERDREIMETALGDGLVTGVERLKESPARSKVLILLSDGRGNIGVASPEAGAQAATTNGIRIYAVGIGTRGGDLDEAGLKQLAEPTGGKYFHASTADGVRKIYGEIDRLERSELKSLRTTRWKDRFALPLCAGIALLAAHRLLRDTRFRSLP